jgi:hypothetical protein
MKSMILEYDYPIFKSFEDLTDKDINDVEELYGKEIRDLYQIKRHKMRVELRKVKIDRILNNIY